MHPSRQTIAYFVTDHGYGHATRSAAVMAAIARRNADVRFEIFTTAPAWLFDEQPALDFRYHGIQTDVGLVQASPLVEDLEATIRALAGFIPFSPGMIDRIAAQLDASGCRLVVCDIAPIGIAAAAHAGIPSVLVENFTWDWIYEGYHLKWPGLRPYTRYLREAYTGATMRIQVEPFCQPVPGSFSTGPVSRGRHRSRVEVREALEIPAEAPMVLLTMGGLANGHSYPEKLPDRRDVVFVVPGAAATRTRRANVILLPPRSDFRHTDLVSAADAVIGKVGYSTLAEVYQAGIPFGYLVREEFRESAALVRFIQKEIPSKAIPAAGYNSGSWQEELSALLAMPRAPAKRRNGAGQVAGYIGDLLAGKTAPGSGSGGPP